MYAGDVQSVVYLNQRILMQKRRVGECKAKKLKYIIFYRTQGSRISFTKQNMYMVVTYSRHTLHLHPVQWSRFLYRDWWKRFICSWLYMLLYWKSDIHSDTTFIKRMIYVSHSTLTLRISFKAVHFLFSMWISSAHVKCHKLNLHTLETARL